LCRCDSSSRSLNGDWVGSSNASRAIARSSRSSIASSLSSACIAAAKWRCAYSNAVSHCRLRISSTKCCSCNKFNSNLDKIRTNLNSFLSHKTHGVVPISTSLAFSQTPAYNTFKLRYKASALSAVHIYIPAFTNTHCTTHGQNKLIKTTQLNNSVNN